MKTNRIAAIVLAGIATLVTAGLASAADVVTATATTNKITKVNERDLMFEAAADNATIDLHFSGASRIDYGWFGELTIMKSNGGLARYRPDVYQVINGKVKPVRVSYKRNGSDRVTMHFSKFDKDAPLILRMGAATL